MERLTSRDSDGSAWIDRSIKRIDGKSNYLINTDVLALNRLAAYEDIGTVEDFKRLVTDNHNLRNELCQKCGRYKEAHNGACNSCKWRAKE